MINGRWPETTNIFEIWIRCRWKIFILRFKLRSNRCNSPVRFPPLNAQLLYLNVWRNQWGQVTGAVTGPANATVWQPHVSASTWSTANWNGIGCARTASSKALNGRTSTTCTSIIGIDVDVPVPIFERVPLTNGRVIHFCQLHHHRRCLDRIFSMCESIVDNTIHPAVYLARRLHCYFH